jgi:deoxyribodipyrimidine photolyase-related protein
MEWFYRDMRRRTGLLMNGDQPVGGVWNLDTDNRNGPAKGLRPPTNPRTRPALATQAVIAEVETRFSSHFGALHPFAWATTAQEAQAEFDWFLDHALPGFGQWQDTMIEGETWMWHAGISTSLHLGLLDPLAVCRAAEARWRDGRAPLNAVEGFIRQIIGWREFVRGVYWLKMPEYALRNALGADRKLPSFFWSGETDMACVADVVTQVRQHAYAHHIQRLMVTGNLAMLLGVAPAEINDWYMVVFADAFEWVELPNTHGMATFADGGIVGSKPYAASGAYIHRMSNYCAGCRYDVKGRLADDACPFNALYWDFLDRNEKRLAGSGRLMMPYKNLSRMDPAERQRIGAKADSLRQAMGAVPV